MRAGTHICSSSASFMSASKNDCAVRRARRAWSRSASSAICRTYPPEPSQTYQQRLRDCYSVP